MAIEMFDIIGGKYRGQYGIILGESKNNATVRICSPEHFYEDVVIVKRFTAKRK